MRACAGSSGRSSAASGASAALPSTSSRPPPGRRSRRSSHGRTSSITTCACPRRAASGIDEDSVRAVNRDIIYCHTSSYGPQGPRADWPGYDQLFQSSCGWEVAGAGEGNPPMWHRFGFMDHLCAMGSVIATLLALYHRDRTGQTQFAAGSLLGGGVLTNSETYLDRRREDRRRCRCSTTSRPASPRHTGSCRWPTDGSPSPPPPTTSSRHCARWRVSTRSRTRRPHSATALCAEALDALDAVGRAVRAGAARPEGIVLRVGRQRRGRDDRALPAHRLRRRRAAGRVLGLRRPRRPPRPCATGARRTHHRGARRGRLRPRRRSTRCWPTAPRPHGRRAA